VKFLIVYDWKITDAQIKLGDMFNRDEYPTRDNLAGKFAFSLNYTPLPDAGDFRIDIGNEALAQIKSQYADHYTDAVRQGHE
jgi:hypothetical protein